ncbi:DUF6286 domain-containing protein [Streptomyces sp. C10-9-1]|uniref:DUF6286 domain-containing protein n=1 Tax=Streptomyces sp. C10-9-1 TaxID=1859285 RepID=UPI0021122C58|nr:DUF6286 domain-containing protein [Streptomyces sp. C10-9-1]MCQ6556671.1 DUF6286 domain-containing protein [Streptomyces sp. C10-9-1]
MSADAPGGTPAEEAAPAAARPPAARGRAPAEPSGPRAGRFWSARRVPAAVLALVLLGATGLLLYDVAAVRADRPAMHWRRALADHLDRWRLDEVAVLAVAAAVVLLGLWLLVLAATPGLRAVLPMRRDRPGVCAGLDREAAALVLRDRAVEVSGVQSAKVRVGRGRATVRARSHFRELDEVRADLDTALAIGLRELGLARPCVLTVHVTRPTGRKA